MIQQKSPWAPILSSWNCDSHPYYIASIQSIIHSHSFKSDFSEKHTLSDSFLFVLNGMAKGNFIHFLPTKSFRFKIDKNDLLFLPSGTSFTIDKVSDDFEYLLINFSIFTCSSVRTQTKALNLSPILSESYEHARLCIDLPFNQHIPSDNDVHMLINQIHREYETQTSGYVMQIQTDLIQVVLSLLRGNSKAFDDILINISHVGITSKYSPNTIMPEGCELQIKDIFLFSDNPETSKHSEILSVFDVSRTTLLNEYQDTISLCLKDKDNPNNKALTISSLAESNYHIWLYDNKKNFKPDLRKYKEKGYFKFSAKCNIEMYFGIVLYNHDIHKCISHVFHITPSTEFAEFCVPFIKKNDEKTLSPYIFDVLDYIENNYKKKITLQELSEQIHITAPYLSKIFKEQVGMSVSEYIVNRRLTAAKFLMKTQSDYSINYIALEVGFYDTAHFSKAFKLKYGVTAQQYKANIEKKNRV